MQTDPLNQARASILGHASKSTPRIYAGGKRRKPTALKAKTICLRLSGIEYEQLRNKAKAAGLSMSELLRDHLGEVRVFNHHQKQQWFATLLSVRKQLSALADRTPGFSPVEEVVTAAYLSAINRHLEWFEKQELPYAGQNLS